MKISVTHICVVVLFLSLVAFGLSMAIGVYTNGYQSIKSRYVAYEGQAVKVGGTIELNGETPEITLSGAGFKYVSWGDYEVKIVINPAANAVYTDGEEVFELGEVDVTELFGIVRDGQKVTITADDYSLEAIIKKLYGDNAELTESNAEEPQYKMTVTDGDGASFEYMLYAADRISIKIDPDHIIAW